MLSWVDSNITTIAGLAITNRKVPRRGQTTVLRRRQLGRRTGMLANLYAVATVNILGRNVANPAIFATPVGHLLVRWDVLGAFICLFARYGKAPGLNLALIFGDYFEFRRQRRRYFREKR